MANKEATEKAAAEAALAKQIKVTTAIANAKLALFQEAKSDLEALLEAHPDVFESFFTTADAYNNALESTKEALRAIPGSAKIDIGPFSRSVPPINKSYVADKLPPSVLRLPGVIKTLDVAVVAQLVLDGMLDPKLAKDAFESKPGTPRVSGPAPVVVAL